MSYLDNLRKFVSENFNATDVKDVKSVENFTKLNSLIDAAEQDYSKVVAANGELSKTLTDYAMHTSIKTPEDAPKQAPNAPAETKVFDIYQDNDFDKALNKFLEEKK